MDFEYVQYNTIGIKFCIIPCRIVCDISCDDGLAEKLSSGGFLFPPVITRQTLIEKHFSPFMRARFVEEDEKLEKTTVVQCFNATQIFIMTDLASFYMDLGLKVSNITKFIQYLPVKTLLPFANKVYEMRVSATYEKDEAKATTETVNTNNSYF